ncbi:MAG: hypothetical protein ACC654_03510 [Acidimicrobiia bacterium]
MDYHRTQTAYLAIVLAVVGAVIVGLLLLPLFDGDMPPILVAVVVAVVLGITLVFTRLTVVLADGNLTVAFGFGWPKRTVDMSDIVAARQVRNTWYQGWGIRLIGGGWMYNVWGLDAIELDLSSGKKFRVGTDDPEGLLAALTLSTSI